MLEAAVRAGLGYLLVFRLELVRELGGFEGLLVAALLRTVGEVEGLGLHVSCERCNYNSGRSTVTSASWISRVNALSKICLQLLELDCQLRELPGKF